MIRVTVRNLICDPEPEGMGLCCIHGYLAVEDLKASKRQTRRLTPSILVHNLGLEYETAKRLLQRWRKGQYTCKKCKNCLLRRSGSEDVELPQMSEHHLSFLRMQGQSFQIMKAQTAPIPRGPSPIRGRIISHSRHDWLWLTLVLEYLPSDIGLGDQLILSDTLWGTIISIDGPTIILLLPFKEHGERNRTVAVTTRVIDPEGVAASLNKEDK